MGGATRFLLLLSPSPLLLHHSSPSLLRLSRRLSCLLHHHHYHHRHSISTSSLLPLTPTTSLTTTTPRHLHVRASSLSHSPPPRISHPWPEFRSLINALSASGYFNRTDSADDYVAAPGLADDFIHAANACLLFARDRPNLLGLLPRRDVEVVVEHGTPFLFRNVDDSVRRMRSFMANDALVTDKANTIDLMRFLLSYASNLSSSLDTNKAYHSELVESSVQNLLGELAKLSNITPESNLSGSVQSQFPHRYGQMPRTSGQKIEMKKGDWICPRCNFTNFARNMKCLECEEARPKRQLTGGEWECPQCNFFNYGRNVVCLRCDCKRPGEVLPGSVPGYRNGSNANKIDIDSRLAANEEKAQRWFSKVSQLESSSDMSSAIEDEDFPEIMPLRKGVNRFVVSTRKTPLERRLENQRNLGNDGTFESNNVQMGAADKTLDMKVGHSLDNNFGHSSASSESKNTENPGETSSKYFPFVPLPADMFAQKPENVKKVETMQAKVDENQSATSNTNMQIDAISRNKDFHNLGDNLQLSERPVNKETADNKDEEAEKSERWFKRISELNDVTDMASAISDEDFPEVMPMRKGENRFVVSKKKDRSLTTPMYKRQMAMEQTNNANFVPFVPFPPDYFAKKNIQQPDAANLTAKADGETSKTSNSMTLSKSNDSRLAVPDIDGVRKFENQQSSSGSLNWKPTEENFTGRKTGETYGTSTNGNSTQNFINQPTSSSVIKNSGYSGKETTNLGGSSSQLTENQRNGMSGKETMNLAGTSSDLTQNQNIRSSWTGKSLEGSAVKEPDPSDMSEEAKTERWFRRVAQIKDISELSEIPDEDFPSIMPMRKGVNRFVVSKRKTPLERRLTSQQYRKNLPVVSSDPVKEEQDSG